MDERARGRIRAARTSSGIGLRELGRQIGVSASMLSQIESGRSEPSVATLYALVNALGVSLDEVLGSPDVAPPAPAPPTSTASALVRADERATLVLESGVRWERLTPQADALVDALLVTYPPGSSSSANGGLMRHTGREYGLLLSGELVVQIGFESQTMRPGDSVTFDSSTPHLYRNDSKQPAVGVWHVIGESDDAGGPATATLPAGPPA